jgi:transcriptional regulator with PAS, ATPase and Fis domain
MFGLSDPQKKIEHSRLNKVKTDSNFVRQPISTRFQKVKEVEDQLNLAVAETIRVTSSIQERLGAHLKITHNTIKAVCQNIREGVIIVNYAGKILEVNSSYEKNFFLKYDDLIGVDFVELIKQQHATEVDGTEFVLAKNFFKSVSKKIFNHTTVEAVNYFDGTFHPQSEAIIMLTPPGEKTKMASFSFAIMDNDPICEEEVSYVLFFKNMQRAEDYAARAAQRQAA